MPMSFPDLNSLKLAAQVHKFRNIQKGESEDAYRNALADYVQSRDLIESCEIRNKVGWNQFTNAQNRDMALRGISNSK